MSDSSVFCESTWFLEKNLDNTVVQQKVSKVRFSILFEFTYKCKQDTPILNKFFFMSLLEEKSRI